MGSTRLFSCHRRLLMLLLAVPRHRYHINMDEFGARPLLLVRTGCQFSHIKHKKHSFYLYYVTRWSWRASGMRCSVADTTSVPYEAPVCFSRVPPPKTKYMLEK